MKRLTLGLAIATAFVYLAAVDLAHAAVREVVDTDSPQTLSNKTLVNIGVTSSGRFVFLSSTELQYKAYNGNRTEIAGIGRKIPSTGVSFANTGLTANTTYYAYVYWDPGTTSMKAEWSTTGHATDGDTGTEVKLGDSSRTLVGLARTNGSSQFVDSAAQRFVLSWFNRKRISTFVKLASNASTTSNGFVEIAPAIRNEFLIWAGEAVHASWSFEGSINSGATGVIGVAFDSHVPDFTGSSNPGNGNNVERSGTYPKTGLSEGFHYATIGAYVSGGALLTAAGGGGPEATVLTCSIWG